MERGGGGGVVWRAEVLKDIFRSSTRWPFHLSPTQDMQVEMINRLTCTERGRKRERIRKYCIAEQLKEDLETLKRMEMITYRHPSHCLWQHENHQEYLLSQLQFWQHREADPVSLHALLQPEKAEINMSLRLENKKNNLPNKGTAWLYLIT